VFATIPERSYFEAWLRRAGKQLAVSGRLSQISLVLALENGGSSDDWRTRLQTFLSGSEVPSIELLTRIDSLLTGPSKTKTIHDDRQGLLF
jgi:hypothetical protein